MSSTTARTRSLRGVLVGVCSAALSIAAHGLAGGELPSGGALLLVVLACATVGAASAALFSGRRVHPLVLLSAALVAGQAVGHFVLVAASGAGASCPTTFSPQMLLAHALAAPACALLVAIVEHLYTVCASALCWRRLFYINPQPPTAVIPCWATVLAVVRQPELIPGGTRAPPFAVFA